MRGQWSAPLATIAVIAVLAPARPSRADDEAQRKARARALLEQGQSRYDLGKFDQAVELFEQAYEVYPFAEALYNLGQCWRKKKDPEKAAHYYRAYLRQAPNAANREFVEGLIVDLERPEPEPPAEPPPLRPAPVPRVAHQATPPAAPDTAQAPRRRSWAKDPLGWTITGVGAVATGVGAWYLVSAQGFRDDVASAPDEFERMRLRAKADDREAIGLPTTIVGGLTLAVGVGLLVWNPSQPVPAVAISNHAGWLLVGGRF